MVKHSIVYSFKRDIYESKFHNLDTPSLSKMFLTWNAQLNTQYVDPLFKSFVSICVGS